MFKKILPNFKKFGLIEALKIVASLILLLYVCVYFFQNLYEINDIVRSLGVIDLIGLIAISALIHLLILPLRMWVLI